METATLTSKSQITIPKAVREALGVTAGDVLQFVPALHGYRLVVIKGDVTTLRGRFAGRRAQPLPVAAFDAALAEQAVARDRRARPVRRKPAKGAR